MKNPIHNLTSLPRISVNVCSKHFLQEHIMGVKKIKGPYYYADYRDFNGVRSRISLQTENKQVALLKYQELIRCKNAVKERIPVNITWQVFKDKLLYYMSVEKVRNTVAHTKLAIRYLEEIKKPRHLQDVTPELVQKYKEHLLTKGVSKNHLNRLVQSIKTAMRMGEKWRYVPKPDWSLIFELKVPRGRIIFHTPEEIDKILNACPSDTWRLVILIGADAGLRRGEIMNLRWDNVDVNNNQLDIAPNKTEYYRNVPPIRRV